MPRKGYKQTREHRRKISEIRKGKNYLNCKHGDAKPGRRTKLYRVWVFMRSRCNSPSCERYKNYGGRGITICREWNDYQIFKAWALANGYEEGLTIDRKDNDADYEPNNCQWITRSQNSKKKRHRL